MTTQCAPAARWRVQALGLDFGVLGYRSLLHFAGNLGLGEFDGITLVLLGQFKSLMQLLLERAVAHLLQDIGVPRLLDFECFASVGADDFMHVGAFCFCLLSANRSFRQW